MRYVQLCSIALVGFGLLLVICAFCACATVVPAVPLQNVKKLQMRTFKGVLEVKAPITKNGDPILCGCHMQQANGGAQLFCNCDRLY